MNIARYFTVFMALLFFTIIIACTSGPSSSSSSSSSSGSVFTPIVAISNPFTTTAGSFYCSRGTNYNGVTTLTDNGLIVSNPITNVINGAVANPTCLVADAFAQSNIANAGSIEVQWNLSNLTVMTNQNFTINFDVLVPTAYRSNMQGLQFAFFNSQANWFNIYSCWFVTSVVNNTWSHISAPVAIGSYITWESDGTFNPVEWIFDKVRIQFCCSAVAPGAIGPECLFYVANLVVSNTN